MAKAQARCELAGESHQVEVTVPGSAPLHVIAQRAQLTAVVRGTRAQAHVEGALAFDGEIDVRSLYLRLEEPGYVGDVVFLGEGAIVRALSADGYSMRVRVELSTDRVDATVEVPCASLAIGEREADTQARLSGDGTSWRARDRSLGVRNRPGGAVVSLVRGPAVFERLEDRGAWQRVVTYGDAAHVAGWVRRADLVRSNGLTGRVARVPRGRYDEYEPREYEAAGLVRPGTPVSATPSGPSWAVTRDLSHFIVRAEPGSEWAQLVRLSGLRDPDLGPFDHAWVPREAVTFLIATPRWRRVLRSRR